MENDGSYILIQDQCPNCLYIANAFTLLRLPFQTIELSQNFQDQSLYQHALAVLICQNMPRERFYDAVQSATHQQRPVIVFHDQATQHERETKQAFTLAMPCSLGQFKEILSLSRQADDYLAPADFSNEVFQRLVGQSPQMLKVKSLIKQIANCDSNALILGQSGTGKDVIASCIHKLSNRKSNPLVPINCGAIPSELMESELFGHEKGAFTGALTKRPGRFEMANTGTLFLDEIGDMPLPMQVKLLRVIQERKIERVGGNSSIDVNVRLIAATNKHLEELIQQKRFREDLYYRLNVFPIHVPSLRERYEDIPLLIDYHLDRIAERLHHRIAFTERAIDILMQYTWPGNIRELANFLERMVILHQDRVLDEKDLDPIYKQDQKKTPEMPRIATQEGQFDIKHYIAQIEQEVIIHALQRSHGVVSAAAAYLSLGRTTLIEKMKKYRLCKHEIAATTVTADED